MNVINFSFKDLPERMQKILKFKAKFIQNLKKSYSFHYIL